MHARMALEPTVHDPGAMGCQTIPNQNNRSLQMTRELTQEVSDLRGSNTLFRMQPEAQGNPISAGPNTQSGHNRDMLVRAHALVQHRCLASRGPTAAHQRCHQKSAFVDKNQRCLQPGGFFLMRGQSCFIQL
jgi:hypothetical protein